MKKFTFRRQHQHHARSNDGHKRPFHRFFKFLKKYDSIRYKLNRQAIAQMRVKTRRLAT